jgi:hypothetical protein
LTTDPNHWVSPYAGTSGNHCWPKICGFQWHSSIHHSHRDCFPPGGKIQKLNLIRMKVTLWYGREQPTLSWKAPAFGLLRTAAASRSLESGSAFLASGHGWVCVPWCRKRDHPVGLWMSIRTMVSRQVWWYMFPGQRPAAPLHFEFLKRKWSLAKMLFFAKTEECMLTLQEAFWPHDLQLGENPTTDNPPYRTTWLQGSRFALPSTACRALFPHLQSL